MWLFKSQSLEISSPATHKCAKERREHFSNSNPFIRILIGVFDESAPAMIHPTILTQGEEAGRVPYLSSLKDGHGSYTS